jgi:hypothetical protein
LPQDALAYQSGWQTRRRHVGALDPFEALETLSSASA